jgi:hypothetical protein
MMHLDSDAKLVGQPLQLAFLQAYAGTIRAAAIGGNNQPRCVRIANTPNLLPPAADRLHGEGCRVMIDAHIK